MKDTFALRLGALMALVVAMSGVTASQAVALSVARPYCVENGHFFFTREDLTGGLRFVSVITPNSESNIQYDRIILASCAAKSQVTVDVAGAEYDFLWARTEVIAMVASSQTYTFQDVVNNISQGGIRAKIDVIQPNSCACAGKE